ncbi:sensor histidine kinase [Sphingomonas crocodyli]|uniref:histidine kinase n=1 Tax=Sphingomonas crocodyli TaxID=1979270 RepID=A0A437M0Y4_9SPHN|nr:sensor histidine kinase [Sphingomonas crocodyli]RVT91225.1 sensor histidine kinase [Sphingomonas crocodyli]
MARSVRILAARLSTGTKMLLILSAALLPLGLIALLTSLDTARANKQQRLTAAQMTTAVYAAQVDSAIDGRIGAMRLPLANARDAADICRALISKVRPDNPGPAIAMFDGNGVRRCQTPGPRVTEGSLPAGVDQAVRIDDARKLLRVTVARPDHSLIAETELPVSEIPVQIADEPGMKLTRLALFQAGRSLMLRDNGAGSIARTVPIGDTGVLLQAWFEPDAVGARNTLLVAIPILMWLAAAFTGWLIVNQVLIYPMLKLQSAIDSYELGHGPLVLPRLNTPAHEIRELAESFAKVSSQIIAHEEELQEGLKTQVKLTREVHHRVKNNLQVISSLINLHARGASDPAAHDAYAAIQRRVDALAVVHRNHFAELEENRGVAMRALAGELASNLRASAPPAASGMPIALNMISANVGQDVAAPVAFLITEVVELMMFCNPKGSILISLEATDTPERALLRIETLALPEDAVESSPAFERFERVITGLARQLRSPLEQDTRAGRFAITIPIMPA